MRGQLRSKALLQVLPQDICRKDQMLHIGRSIRRGSTSRLRHLRSATRTHRRTDPTFGFHQGDMKPHGSPCALGVDFHAEVTQVFHRELTHLEVMFRGSVLGQDIIVLPLFSSCYDGTGFEAEAVISGLQDVAAVG